MKLICSILIFLSYSASAQQTIKIKREDNRFAFFQIGVKNDTIIKNKSDLFYIKFPDNQKQNIQITLKNAKFSKTENDSIFRLIPINGMKYSHTKPDTILNTLLEGNCSNSKSITIEIRNTVSQERLIKNTFIAK